MESNQTKQNLSKSEPSGLYLKKTWIMPEIEVISNDAITNGTSPFYHEGVPTPLHFEFGVS